MVELLEEAHQVLGELLRMHSLNQELLETLSVTASWLRDYAERNNIPFPNSSTYASLINKAETLIQELSTKNPLEQMDIRRNFTAKTTRRRLPRIHACFK